MFFNEPTHLAARSAETSTDMIFVPIVVLGRSLLNFGHQNWMHKTFILKKVAFLQKLNQLIVVLPIKAIN